jgi:hypothetical protein
MRETVRRRTTFRPWPTTLWITLARDGPPHLKACRPPPPLSKTKDHGAGELACPGATTARHAKQAQEQTGGPGGLPAKVLFFKSEPDKVHR